MEQSQGGPRMVDEASNTLDPKPGPRANPPNRPPTRGVIRHQQTGKTLRKPRRVLIACEATLDEDNLSVWARSQVNCPECIKEHHRYDAMTRK